MWTSIVAAVGVLVPALAEDAAAPAMRRRSAVVCVTPRR
jgi:hypothetical protein